MQNESERTDPQTTPAGAAAGDGQETADRDAVRHSADGESLMTVEVSAAPETTSDPSAAVPQADAEAGDTADPAAAAAAAMLPSGGRETIIEIDQDDDDTPVSDETAADTVGDPQEVIISGHSSTDLVDDDAVAGRRHGRGRCGDVVCAAAG